MTSVWLAEVSETERTKRLLLKTIRPRGAEDAALVKTLMAEASVAAKLAHPNVMDVVDFGEIDGRYFMATEFLPGRSLRQIDRRARKANQQVDLWFLLRVAIDVCAALSYIHSFDGGGTGSSLVHLDVRPQTIMVAFNGLVKLHDLGVGTANAGPAPGAQSGRCRYLTPERVESSGLRPTSDTYALGVVLYEYATGVLPFEAQEAPRAAHRTSTVRPLPPGVHNAALAGPLSDIILRSIAGDPADRYQSAAALARDLTDYLAQVEPDSLDHPLDTYVSELFPGEVTGRTKVVARPSFRQKDPSAPQAFRSQVESSEAHLPPSIPPVVGWHGPAPATDSMAQPSGALPPLGVSPGASGNPANDPFALARRSASICAAPTLGTAGDRPPSSSRDLFASWRPSRTHLAFSMAQTAPRENGASPPLGSVFSSRKSTPPVAPSHPMLSPEARRALAAFDRGLDLVQHKDHRRALEAWREAVSLDPGNRTYQANVKRLERLIASSSV